MNFSKITKCLITALSFYGFNLANASEINYIELGNDSNNRGIITLEGEIKATDVPKFINLADLLTKQNKEIVAIDLNSHGGSVAAAIEIADYILKNKLNTSVRPYNTCGSACFLIFMAGTYRYADPDAKMFVHRISIASNDSLEAKGYSVEMNELYQLLNVPQNLRIAMLETPPEQIYILDKRDIDAINSGFEQRETDRIRAGSEALNPDSDDESDTTSDMSQGKSQFDQVDPSDIRSGPFATDAYYKSIAKYDVTNLSFDQAVRKLEAVSLSDPTGVPEYLIGKMYQDGLSGKKENGKAWTYYEKAAGKGNGLAIFRMGVYYHINKNDDEALKYIIKALQQGVPNAINYAGYWSEQGIVIPKNLEDARKFYEIGTNMGNEQSPYALGMLYLNGNGVTKNKPKACKLFKIAYQRGNAKAYNVAREVCR